MNKKLVVVAALIFGAAGLFLANTVKAQDATDNSAMATDNSAMAADNGAMANGDTGAAMNSDAGAAPAAQ